MEFTLYIIWESTDESNKVKKNRNYTHKKGQTFYRIQNELSTRVLTRKQK